MIRLALVIVLFCASLGAATLQKVDAQTSGIGPLSADACVPGGGTGTGDPRSAWVPAANASAILGDSPWMTRAPADRASCRLRHLAVVPIAGASTSTPRPPHSRQPLTLPLLI